MNHARVTPTDLDEAKRAAQALAELTVRLAARLSPRAPLVRSANRAAKALIDLEYELKAALATPGPGRPRSGA